MGDQFNRVSGIRIPKHTTTESYLKRRLKILKRDFMLDITPNELTYLKSLKTEIAIDNAIRKIVIKHWGEY